MDERGRPPRRFWPVGGASLALLIAFVLVVGHTHRVAWYAAVLLLLAGALMIWSWVLVFPSLVHRLRPSSYEHKSTAGERVWLGVLWAMLVGVVVTTSTGPWCAALVLATACVLGWLVLNRRQKQRIRRTFAACAHD
jgi:cobalamin synthase